MKHINLLLIACLLNITTTFSQTCLPEGISLVRQSQIDSFNIVYPDCTEIMGDLTLKSDNPSDIVNVEALTNLTTINGNLEINDNAVLETLTGLENISRINGNLVVFNNAQLRNILGLNSIKIVGGSLSITNNGKLTTLDGLDNLLTIGGNLSIRNNDFLIRITSLENLIAINGDLTVWGNSILRTINGLNNIDHSTINSLELRENSELAECATNSICNYLENGGSNAIGNNAYGCSVFETVLSACSVMSHISLHDIGINIAPNPANQLINIMGLNSKSNYQIINSLGKIIKAGQVGLNNTIDLSDLNVGIYMLSLSTDQSFIGQQKFLKM